MLTEWDPDKARLNASKHGVSFADAVASLEDEGALTMRDLLFDDEERWVTMGRDCLGRVNAEDTRMQMKREYDFSKAKRGPVIPVPKGKTRITIRLDEDVITWFRTQVEKAGGGNYQSLINDALRQHIAQTREPLEETLRRVVREEIKRAS